MDMPNADAGNQADTFGNVKMGAGLHPPMEVLHVLAIDIIEGDDPPDAIGIVPDGMNEGVVHVDLSELHRVSLPKAWHRYERYLSPF